MLPLYETEVKSKLPVLWTNRGEILENVSYNFLASVPLTKQNQVFQVQAGIDLLGEVDCLSSTQFCSTCAPFHMAEEWQQVYPAALSCCSHSSPCQTTVSRKLGMKIHTRSIGLSVQGISFIPCPGHLERQGNFQNATFFFFFPQNALLLSSVTITFLLFVQKLVFLFWLLPTVVESAQSL